MQHVSGVVAVRRHKNHCGLREKRVGAAMEQNCVERPFLHKRPQSLPGLILMPVADHRLDPDAKAVLHSPGEHAVKQPRVGNARLMGQTAADEPEAQFFSCGHEEKSRLFLPGDLADFHQSGDGMDFLRVLDAVRSITGMRGEDRFPHKASAVVALPTQEGRRVVMVHDAGMAKAVLESDAYRQYNFVERILSVAKPERTARIRRFCDIGLIMIDGPEHERRRVETARLLDRCVQRLLDLPPDKVARFVEDAIQSQSPAAARDIGRALVVLLFSECLAAVTGQDGLLLDDTIFAIDFFNPFPTLSTLYRCDEALSRSCEKLGVERLGEAEEATALSLLVMGVSPLYAMFTALVNAAVEAMRSGQDMEQAVRRVRGVDAYSVVPTNFVMRACIAETEIGGENISPGDIVYLFLGSATGCPFSRLTAIPFGAGRHYCSGAKLTSTMLSIVRNALPGCMAALRRVESSAVEQGKAAAFLMYSAPVATQQSGNPAERTA